jgi:hypothetical protein
VLVPLTLVDYSAEALEEPSRGILESFTSQERLSYQMHTYTELRQQIHDDLRLQHPEWVEPNGESPIYDSYEARLTELIDAMTQRGSNESIAAPHHTLEQALNWVDTVVV